MRLRAAAVVAIVVASTLDQGGGGPVGLLIVHGAIVAVWIAIVARGGSDRAHAVEGSALGAALAFGAAATLASIGAPDAYAAFLVLQDVASAIAVFALAASVGPRLVGSLGPALLAAAVAHATFALVQWGGGDPRPASTFLNPNHFASWAVAVLALCAATVRALPSVRARRVAWAAIASVALVVLLVSSRGAFVAAGAAVVTAVYLAWGRWSVRSRLIAVIATVTLAAVFAAMVVQRFETDDPFAYHRVEIWRASASAVEDRPLLGIGPGQFVWRSATARFDDGEPPLRFDRTYSTPHSDWLRLLIDYGAVGTLAFAAWMIAVFACSRRRLASEDPGEVVAARGAWLALVAMTAHASVENVSDRPAIVLLAAVLAGAMCAGRRSASRSGSRLGPGARVAIVTTLVVVWGVGDLVPFDAWRLARSSVKLSDAEAVARLERAVERNPLQPHLKQRLAERIVGAGLDRQGYARARELAERAIALDPRDARVWRAAARVEAAGCRELFRDVRSRERAAERFERAQELAPFDPFLSLELADFLMTTGDLGGALRAVERAIAIEPRAPVPHLARARALALADDPDALEALETARAIADRIGAPIGGSSYAVQLTTLDPEAVAWVERRVGR